MSTNKVNQQFIMDPPFHVTKFIPVGREQKRAYLREVEKINVRLFTVEASFYKAIFEDYESSYQAIYTFHHDWFKLEIEQIKRLNKFKYISLIEDYFAKHYAPQL